MLELSGASSASSLWTTTWPLCSYAAFADILLYSHPFSAAGGAIFNDTDLYAGVLAYSPCSRPWPSHRQAMTTSRFTHINQAFTCIDCGSSVPPRASGCRNHCPHCLVSLHVDINPGDRANPCQGIMDAIAYELSGKKGLVLVFRCRRCAQITRNIAAHEDSESADDYARILRL